jgi:hypothetical protein
MQMELLYETARRDKSNSRLDVFLLELRIDPLLFFTAPFHSYYCRCLERPRGRALPPSAS